ncbi:MAG: recombination mediator RecR [Candidatus Nomurabacteria bacterium]|jgi:recombination protein RecR|nr:recombination mediator RecR [Candidatus Nomurabacteria bacterium]
MLPKALKQAIEDLGRLPGVGARTAERYGYFLLKSDRKITENIVESLDALHDGVKFCPVTFALIDASEDTSPLYTDPSRDKATILVVQEPLDIIAVERTGGYHGTYHVLGGAISPIDDIGPGELHISELIDRIGKDGVLEVIIATNASVEGESTAIFLQRELKDRHPDLKISRLARGIPAGVDLEYADQITLTHALEGRREYS